MAESRNYMVRIEVTFDATSAEEAQALAQTYVDHILATGPDADLPAPEDLTITGVWAVD